LTYFTEINITEWKLFETSVHLNFKRRYFSYCWWNGSWGFI